MSTACSMISKEEVRENRKKLIIELSWVWMNTKIMCDPSLSQPRQNCHVRPSILIRNSLKTRLQPHWAVEFCMRMEFQFRFSEHSQHVVTQWINYVQTLPNPRTGETVLTLGRRSRFRGKKSPKLLPLLLQLKNKCSRTAQNAGRDAPKPIGEGIRINLKRRDVALYTYY